MPKVSSTNHLFLHSLIDYGVLEYQKHVALRRQHAVVRGREAKKGFVAFDAQAL